METSHTIGHQRRRADKSRCATSFCRPKANNLAKTRCLWLTVTGDGVFFLLQDKEYTSWFCDQNAPRPQHSLNWHYFWGTTCWSQQPKAKHHKSTETYHLGPPTWSRPHDLGVFMGSNHRACVAVNRRGPNKRNFQLQRCRYWCEASKTLTLKDVFVSLPLHPLLKFQESCLGATARLWHRSGFHLFWQTAQWHHCTAMFWGFKWHQWNEGYGWRILYTVYWMCIYLFYLSIWLSVCLSACLSVCLSAGRPLPIYISLSVCSIFLSVYL